MKNILFLISFIVTSILRADGSNILSVNLEIDRIHFSSGKASVIDNTNSVIDDLECGGGKMSEAGPILLECMGGTKYYFLGSLRLPKPGESFVGTASLLQGTELVKKLKCREAQRTENTLYLDCRDVP